MAFLDRLAARSAAVGSVLCLGLDPDPAELPAGFPPSVAGIESFARLILDAAIGVAAAVKPNLAFFEAYGSAGLAALERLRTRIPPEIPVVVDAKRADIGSTAARQAVAIFDALGADAVTVNPYLGADAIEPFLAGGDRFVYVLCRTSNPAAGQIQDLVVGEDPRVAAPAEAVWARVARWAADRGRDETIGLVVGATARPELRAVRAIAPALPFLVPGLGAQGGDLGAVLADGRASAGPAATRPGGGLLVNVSRAIARAALDRGGRGDQTRSRNDPAAMIAAAAAEWSARLPVLS